MIERYVSPEELRKLLSALAVVAGAILLFALFDFIVVPGLRNANKPEAGPAVSPPQGETGWLDVTEYPPAKGYDVPPVDPKTVLAASPETLARGKALFAANCTACHGEAGKGDGPGGKGLNPPPRNFTSPDKWVNGSQLAGIYKTLGEGIKGSSMAAFDTLPARDRMAVAHYVQSLGAFPHGDTEASLQALGKQFASKGERVPNKIPVSTAMRKLEVEYASPPPLPVPVAPVTPEGALLRRIVTDRNRAARTLAGTPFWREDLAALERAAAEGAPGNGFAVEAATLGPDEWKAVQALLSRLVPGDDRLVTSQPWKRERGERKK